MQDNQTVDARQRVHDFWYCLSFHHYIQSGYEGILHFS